MPDYWGKDLPVNIGKDNFEEIRWEYYRDDTVELEAFKGEPIRLPHRDLGQELRATGYHFPAKRDTGCLETFPERARG